MPPLPRVEEPQPRASLKRRGSGILSRRPLRRLALHLAQPGKLGADLLHTQAEHPHRFMEWVADLPQHLLLNPLLAAKLVLQKLPPPPELAGEDARPALPGERQPGQKRRPL